MDGSVSKADFARIYGCDPAYVTRLHQRGKLVMTADGKRVMVEPTLRLIEATRDLTKQGVRDRWAAYRSGARLAATCDAASAGGGAEASGGDPLPASPSPFVTKPDGATKPNGASAAGEPVSSRPTASPFQLAQTELTRAQAAIKQLELRKMSGDVAEIEPMRRALVDVVVAARAAIAALPDRVASQVAAESDPAKVHVLLTAECERICETAQRSVELLLREAARAAA